MGLQNGLAQQILVKIGHKQPKNFAFERRGRKLSEGGEGGDVRKFSRILTMAGKTVLSREGTESTCPNRAIQRATFAPPGPVPVHNKAAYLYFLMLLFNVVFSLAHMHKRGGVVYKVCLPIKYKTGRQNIKKYKYK